MAIQADLAFDITDTPQITDKVTTDGTSAGPPVNISGWALSVTLHRWPGDNTPVAVYTTVGGQVTISDGPNGIYSFTVSSADMQNLGPGVWRWHTERVDPGQGASLTRGIFEVRAV